jgi:protein involved in polysaccharide export with SLBB domain
MFVALALVLAAYPALLSERALASPTPVAAAPSAAAPSAVAPAAAAPGAADPAASGPAAPAGPVSSAGTASAGVQPARVQVDGIYRIHVGDQIAVTVAGEQNPTQVLKVVHGGSISYPLVGTIFVAGLTPAEATAAVVKALSKYMRHPVVTVGVVQEGQIEVLVLGNVKNPNKYSISSQGRLYDAIAAAGGLGPTDGDMPTARVGTADGKISQYSLQKLLQEGDVSQNAPLTDQATVYVESPLTFNVRVVGDVQRAGDVVLHEGDRLSTAIARAGPTQTANLNNVTFARVDADGKKVVQQIDLYQILAKAEFEKDVVMQKGDFVAIPIAQGHHDTVSGPAALLNAVGQFFHFPAITF